MEFGIRNSHYRSYRSCLPIYGIAIVRSLSFLFIDDFEENANISVAIKSGFTVLYNYKGYEIYIVYIVYIVDVHVRVDDLLDSSEVSVIS